MGLANKVMGKIARLRPVNLNVNFVQSGIEFAGRRALVLGGGTGIGLAIAEELVQNGAEAVVCGRRHHACGDIISEVLDVSRIDGLTAGLEELVGRYSGFDIVVNSQGICPDVDFRQDFYAVTKDDFENVMRVNMESVFFVSQYFCNYFESRHIAGNILNICSTEGLKGNIVPYGLSKVAVISLTKGLGKKMASKNIVVNGIAPGATATDMMKMSSDGNLRCGYIPSQRASVPVEIAKAAHLLLSDAGRQMCGQIVVVDGGESLK